MVERSAISAPSPSWSRPQGVHEPVHRDDDAAVDEEPGDERPGLHATDVDEPAVPGDLDGPEDADLQAGRHGQDVASRSSADQASRPDCRAAGRHTEGRRADCDRAHVQVRTDDRRARHPSIAADDR